MSTPRNQAFSTTQRLPFALCNVVTLRSSACRTTQVALTCLLFTQAIRCRTRLNNAVRQFRRLTGVREMTVRSSR